MSAMTIIVAMLGVAVVVGFVLSCVVICLDLEEMEDAGALRRDQR